MGAADLGTPMWVVYECVGSGKEEISTYDKETLRVSLKIAIKNIQTFGPSPSRLGIFTKGTYVRALIRSII